MTNLRGTFEKRIEEMSNSGGPSDIVDLLADLPPETDREWELALTRIAESLPDWSDEFRRIFEDEVADITDTETIQWAAFFCYCTHLRRRGNIDDLGQLLDTYKSTFGDHPMYPHLRALHQKQLRTASSYQRAIDYAERAQERVTAGHEGVEHSYATAIVRALEDGHAGDLDVDSETLLERADSTMDRIMTDPVYPKFKVTLGRIRALQGQYNEALQLINEGISLEDDSKDSYALRINNYRTHESRVYLEKYRTEIERQQAKLEENVDSAVEKIDDIQDESEDQFEKLQEKTEEKVTKLQGQTLQFLGFFSTLLAVIISTVTISLNFSIVPAAALIIVLIGGLLIAFGGFAVILPVDKALKRGVLLFSMGLVTTGIGFIIAAVIGGVI